MRSVKSGSGLVGTCSFFPLWDVTIDKKYLVPFWGIGPVLLFGSEVPKMEGYESRALGMDI